MIKLVVQGSLHDKIGCSISISLLHPSCQTWFSMAPRVSTLYSEFKIAELKGNRANAHDSSLRATEHMLGLLINRRANNSYSIQVICIHWTPTMSTNLRANISSGSKGKRTADQATDRCHHCQKQRMSLLMI